MYVQENTSLFSLHVWLFCDLMDYTLPGCSVHGILQETILYLIIQKCPALRLYGLYSPSGSSVHGDSLGKNAGMDCKFLLQGIFPIPWLNQCLLHWCWFSRQVVSNSYDPMDCGPPGSSSMGFPREEYWSGLPFPSPGDLPDAGIKPGSLDSLLTELPRKPAFVGEFFTTESPGNTHM